MEITYYAKSKDPLNKIVAEFGLKIPEWDLYFSKMKLIRTAKGHLFVSAPSYKYQDKENKDVYKEYWFFGKETSKKFFEQALEIVQAHIEKTYGISKEVEKEEDNLEYSDDIF
jgi:hypothetical protein